VGADLLPVSADGDEAQAPRVRVLALERLGQRERAARLERAVRRAIEVGSDLTPDLGGRGTTATFTDRVVAELAGA